MIKETKNDRFKRLAEHRTNEIIKKLHTLGNCSNRSAYDYSEDDVLKIFNAMEKIIKDTKARFYFPKNKRKNKSFSF